MTRHRPPIWIILPTVVLVYGTLSVAVERFVGLPLTFPAPAWLTWFLGGLLIVVGMTVLGFAIHHLSLRRAFGALAPTERRYLLENVLAARHIGDKARAAQAVLLEKDKEKLAAMSADLSQAMDDLDDLL